MVGDGPTHFGILTSDKINQSALNISQTHEAINEQIDAPGSSMHCTMPSFTQGMVGNLNLSRAELAHTGEHPRRQASQARLDSTSSKSLHQSMASNKQMVNIKSYCDIGRSMSNVRESSGGNLGSQTHGQVSLTRGTGMSDTAGRRRE
jgi:hypothetical protein